MTREEWLELAIEALKISVQTVAHRPLPPIKVSTGFPSYRALSQTKRVVGQCFPPDLHSHVAHLFISPVLDNKVDVLATLLHELVHAVLPAGTGHKGKFPKLCKELGLEGKPTSPVPGEELAARLNAIPLPDYPHLKLDPAAIPKPQRTRLRLWECQCPVKVRVASEKFQATCNVCHEQFNQVGRDARLTDHP